MPEPLLGLHVSIAGSLELAFERAEEVGANTFQIFTRNPNQWKFKPIPAETVAAFKEKRGSKFKRIVDHMPYLPNLASPDRSTMKISRFTLTEELKRCDELGIDYLVAHQGSHLGKGTAAGVANVAGACREAIDASEGEATVLLENMAGQKNCVGARFEELRMILDKVGKERVGVCLDSCHAFAAGFDLASKGAVEQSMGLFEEVVGFDRLKVLHLNDSKGPLGGNLDRHEHIGMGNIGPKGFKEFLHYKGVSSLPLLMETPQDNKRSDREELAYVRKLISG